MVRTTFNRFGLDLNRYPVDPYLDAARHLAYPDTPIVFDVGANVGQTVSKIQKLFPRAQIHAFEPSHTTFSKLSELKSLSTNVHLNNCGVGAEAGELEFNETSRSVMSSFLEPGDIQDAVVARKKVPIISIDEYCLNRGVKKIDTLKIDTQSFEYQVLLGANRMLTEKSISIIIAELIVADTYKELTPLHVVLELMHTLGYKLGGFYNQHRRYGYFMSWADVVFLTPSLKPAELWNT